MPFALQEAGFYSGVVLLCMVACLTDYTVRLLIRLAKQTNKHYYEQLSMSQFGRAGYTAVLGAMGVFAYGAMTAYLILIGDTMSVVVSSSAGYTADMPPPSWVKRVVLVAIATFCVLPLSLLKDMAKLSKTSFVSLCSVFFIICVVAYNWLYEPGGGVALPVPGTPDHELLIIGPKIFPAIGIIAFAFVMHHACFIVYNSLEDNTEPRWAKTVHISVFVAWSVMTSLAMLAYLTFRGVMKPSFLLNYSNTDPIVNSMRVMFALAQVLTFPIELFVARHAVHALLFPHDKKFSDKQHYVITLVLWASSLAIALNVTDLSVVLELTGGVSAVFIGFVLPPLLHFKLTAYDWRLWRNPMGTWKGALVELLPSMFTLCFGLLAMILTITTIGCVCGGGVRVGPPIIVCASFSHLSSLPPPPCAGMTLCLGAKGRTTAWGMRR